MIYPSATPGSETNNVRKKDSSVWKMVSNRFGLEDFSVIIIVGLMERRVDIERFLSVCLAAVFLFFHQPLLYFLGEQRL
jgi:hypothetical protein